MGNNGSSGSIFFEQKKAPVQTGAFQIKILNLVSVLLMPQ
jgi:hypothetical protein